MFVTHDGAFHADDVFAAAILGVVFGDSKIVRTRNQELIAHAEIAFDVGGGDYDHHQMTARHRANGIPFASAGLIWRKYGADVIKSLATQDSVMSPTEILAIAEQVDQMLIQQIDAADNDVSLLTVGGIDSLTGIAADAAPALLTVAPAFPGVRPVSVSSLIAWHNPTNPDPSAADFDQSFDYAVDFATMIIVLAVRNAASIVESRIVIEAARDAAIEFDLQIVTLRRYVPDWQRSIIGTPALYVIYPSAGSWRCQCVPQSLGVPGSKRLLPASWAGLDATDLQRISGVDDATFCHKGLFIAGALSEDGAFKLALMALTD